MTPAGLLRLLTILALLLAPLTMIGGHAAMAAPSPMPAMTDHMAMAPDHCAGMDTDNKARPDSAIDCTIVCAALPAIGDTFPVPLAFPAAAERAPRIATRAGIQPEAATPPPRFS